MRSRKAEHKSGGGLCQTHESQSQIAANFRYRHRPRPVSLVDEGLVDQIVVYKIDRLTRSLADFAKLVDRLDAADASIVSVTQSFNTATSIDQGTERERCWVRSVPIA